MKNNKIVKNIAISILTLSLFLSSSLSVFAADYYTFNDHVLNGGVGNYGVNNRYYFITASASTYSSSFQTAMSDWIYTTSRLGVTTPISYVQTTTQSSSVLDVYAVKLPITDTTLAYTDFIRNGSEIDPYTQNWGWNKVTFNITICATTNIGTAAHEIGHAFGLAHNNSNVYSIMCQTGSGRKVSQAQVCDLNGINHLY